MDPRAVRGRGSRASGGRRAPAALRGRRAACRARAAPAPGPRSRSSACGCTRPPRPARSPPCSPPPPATTCSTPASRGCARVPAPSSAWPPSPGSRPPGPAASPDQRASACSADARSTAIANSGAVRVRSSRRCHDRWHGDQHQARVRTRQDGVRPQQLPQHRGVHERGPGRGRAPAHAAAGGGVDVLAQHGRRGHVQLARQRQGGDPVVPCDGLDGEGARGLDPASRDARRVQLVAVVHLADDSVPRGRGGSDLERQAALVVGSMSCF